MFKLEWFYHRKIIIFSCFVALLVGCLVNFFSLHLEAREEDKTYWQGQVDEKLKEGENRDKALLDKLDIIEKEIKGVCNDINDIKIQALKNGIIYGSGSGGTVYLLTLAIQGLIKRRNGK